MCIYTIPPCALVCFSHEYSFLNTRLIITRFVGINIFEGKVVVRMFDQAAHFCNEA